VTVSTRGATPTRVSADARGARRQVWLACLLLGVGLGGFFDGIVLHQLLQWHHMLSSTGRWSTTTMHGLKVNTLADGLFHAATYAITIAGLGLFWHATAADPRPCLTRRVFGGLLLAGWGLFNLTEGLIDHELLGIHHVRSGAQHRVWDLAFLAWGASMLALGAWLARPAATQRGV
jgi:uncharacterized membrane protein